MTSLGLLDRQMLLLQVKNFDSIELKLLLYLGLDPQAFMGHRIQLAQSAELIELKFPKILKQNRSKTCTRNAVTRVSDGKLSPRNNDHKIIPNIPGFHYTVSKQKFCQ